MKTKEEIYDEQINPLMAQIIAICQEHKIAMLADFAVPNNEDNGLQCTTALLGDETNPPATMLQAFELLRPDAKPLMLKLQHADGSVTMTAIFP